MAGGVNIGELFGTISLEDTFSSGLDRSAQAVQGFEQQTQKSFEGAAKSTKVWTDAMQSSEMRMRSLQDEANKMNEGMNKFSGIMEMGKESITEMSGEAGMLGKALSTLGPAGIAAGAGIGVMLAVTYEAGEAMKQAIEHWAEAAHQLEILHAQTGFSISGLQELGFAAKAMGQDMSTVGAMATKMEMAIEKGSPAFDRLNLSAAQLKEEKPEQAFDEITSAIAGTTDQFAKVTAAREFFGRSGATMLPMIEQMEHLKQISVEMGFAGTASFDADQKSAASLAVAGNELSLAWEGVKNQFAAGILQGTDFKSLMETMSPVFHALGEEARGWGQAFQVAGEMIYRMIPGLQLAVEAMKKLKEYDFMTYHTKATKAQMDAYAPKVGDQSGIDINRDIGLKSGQQKYGIEGGEMFDINALDKFVSKNEQLKAVLEGSKADLKAQGEAAKDYAAKMNSAEKELSAAISAQGTGLDRQIAKIHASTAEKIKAVEEDTKLSESQRKGIEDIINATDAQEVANAKIAASEKLDATVKSENAKAQQLMSEAIASTLSPLDAEIQKLDQKRDKEIDDANKTLDLSEKTNGFSQAVVDATNKHKAEAIAAHDNAVAHAQFADATKKAAEETKLLTALNEQSLALDIEIAKSKQDGQLTTKQEMALIDQETAKQIQQLNDKVHAAMETHELSAQEIQDAQDVANKIVQVGEAHKKAASLGKTSMDKWAEAIGNFGKMIASLGESGGALNRIGNSMQSFSSGFAAMQKAGGFGTTAGKTQAAIGATNMIGDLLGGESTTAGSVVGGMGQGAAMGAVAGPWGAAVGAVVGGIVGFFKHKHEEVVNAAKKAATDMQQLVADILAGKDVGGKTVTTMIPALLKDKATALDVFKNMAGEFTQMEEQLKAKILETTQAGVGGLTDMAAYLGKQTDATQKDFDHLDQYAMGLFGSLRKQGMSMLDALAQIKPALDQMQKQADAKGMKLGAGSASLEAFASILDKNKELVAAAEGAGKVLEGLRQSGSLTQDTFDSLQQDEAKYIDKLKAAGLTTQQALAVAAPALYQMKQAHEKLGMALDATTQKEIDAAEAAGLFDGMEDPIDVMKKGMDAMVEVMAAIAKSFGVTLPENVQKYIDSLNKIPNVPPPPGAEAGGTGAAGGTNDTDGQNSQPHGKPPGYATGTGGLRDFGTETIVALHNKEAVVTENDWNSMKNGSFRQDNTAALTQELAGLKREFRTLVATALPRAVRDAVLLGGAKK